MCERMNNKVADLSTTWCEQDWIMLDLDILTKSTCTIYIQCISLMDCTILEEDHLPELEGTCGWDPWWRGALAI